MRIKEQIFLCKRLSYLMNADISLVESLEILRAQAGARNQRMLFDRMLAEVEEGRTLSRAFAAFPRVFGEFCVSMVQVGERSGTLPAALEHVAVELTKKQQLRSKVFGAFIYPAVIALATLGITIFLILFLFPKIMPIFKSLHAELPLSTRVVVAVSSFLLHDWLLLSAVIALVVVGSVVAYKRSTRVRLAFERALLMTPAFGSMLKSYYVSNASRMLGLLLQNGMTLSEAVAVAAEATRNLVYKRELEALGAVVARGDLISTHLASRAAYFPPLCAHMVAVGERSGTLSEALMYVADLYGGEVDERAKILSALVEPVLMVCMGLLVGFIAVSIITPIYGITQNLHT
ncbi:MAG TPA: type II secretion system F family protein [Candidatus Paceibacterota bacterium]|nr:type II secretion system F family protein [Candidatus Paceibacterota bacterium]